MRQTRSSACPGVLLRSSGLVRGQSKPPALHGARSHLMAKVASATLDKGIESGFGTDSKVSSESWTDLRVSSQVQTDLSVSSQVQTDLRVSSQVQTDLSVSSEAVLR